MRKIFLFIKLKLFEYCENSIKNGFQQKFILKTKVYYNRNYIQLFSNNFKYLEFQKTSRKKPS